ncbi:MarR family transcriptional regulator [Pediococcus pentosaceus]|nr:MarR family transcriptional regulator [Pediococcus pentosaceus]
MMSQASDINFLMRKIQIKEHQLASEVSGQYDLTETQAKTLGFIEKFPGTNQKNIADSFSLSNASTSAIIKKLVTRGFIEKKPNVGSQDRSNRLYLTAAGVNISIDIRKELSKIENIIA